MGGAEHLDSLFEFGGLLENCIKESDYQLLISLPQCAVFFTNLISATGKKYMLIAAVAVS